MNIYRYRHLIDISIKLRSQRTSKVTTLSLVDLLTPHKIWDDDISMGLKKLSKVK